MDTQTRLGTVYERLMWFVCVNVSAVAAMIIIVSLWEKFQTNPTITGLDTDFHNWDVAFPAITVCQNMPANQAEIDDYLERNKKSGNGDDISNFIIKLSRFSYDNLEYYKKNSTRHMIPNDVKLKDFIFPFMNPCESVFNNCVWKSEKYDCCQGFYPVFTETGFCYTFNSRHYERKTPWKTSLLPSFEQKYIKETDIKWSLKFDIISNVTDEQIPIYIHNSDELPGVDTKPQHLWEFKVDKISFSVKQTYTTENTRQLSIKQRHCIFEDEVKLAIDYKYTYTACTRQCRMDTAKRLCNCVPHFYPESGKYRHCTLKELACIADNVRSILSVDHCSCQLGCANTVYEVEKLNDNGESQGLESEFVSWPMVRYKREVLFGWVDLLVSFGGIAGLFLGFSLLSGVEFIYYFTIRACCMVNMQTNDLEKTQTDNNKKELTTYDMSLLPAFLRRKTKGNRRNDNLRRFGSIPLRKAEGINFSLQPINIYDIAKVLRNILPPVKDRKTVRITGCRIRKHNNKKIHPRPFRIGKEEELTLSPFGIEFLN